MKQFFLIILALLTILIGVSILPDLFREIKAKRKINKNDALTLAGLMLAIIPFALLLPNATVEFREKAYEVEEDSAAGKVVTIQLKNRQLFPVTVELEANNNIVSGNPAEKDDYEPVNELIRLDLFNPSAQIVIQPRSDQSHEGNEIVNLRLSNPSNAELGNLDEVPFTILDNDPEPEIEFSAEEYHVTEPAAEQSVTIMDIPVTLTAPSDFPVTVAYSTRLVAR